MKSVLKMSHSRGRRMFLKVCFSQIEQKSEWFRLQAGAATQTIKFRNNIWIVLTKSLVPQEVPCGIIV